MGSSQCFVKGDAERELCKQINILNKEFKTPKTTTHNPLKELQEH